MAAARRPAAHVQPVDALRALMADHALMQREVADLAGVSAKTVESWLAAPGSASHRTMPSRHITLIRAMLPGFIQARKRAA